MARSTRSPRTSRARAGTTGSTSASTPSTSRARAACWSAPSAARAARRTGRGVREHRLLPLLLRVPDRRRGAGEPAHAPRLAGDVAREHRPGAAGPGPDRAGMRHPAALASPESPQAYPGRRGRRDSMRILDRYLLREFVVYLLLGLLGFIVIFAVVDLIEKMDVFLDHKAPWLLVAQYFVNLAPDVVVKMLPVALLLATFLALGQLNKFGVLTAMGAGGLSLLRILQPVFAVAFACVALSLVLG